LLSNHQVPRSEFYTPQTSRRLPSGSLDHEGRLYLGEEQIYFDHETSRWRFSEGHHPLPDEPFQGPYYIPGRPEEALPEHLRTQSTAVVGPVQGSRSSFRANTESSDEEGTSGTNDTLEYASADQEETRNAELEQQEGTAVPPTPVTQPLRIELPPHHTRPVTPVDEEMVGQDDNQGMGGIKMPYPEKFNGNRSKCNGFLASCGAYFTVLSRQFDTDEKKIAFTLMLCEGGAATWRDTEFAKFENEPPTNGTWVQFKARFKTQWGEVNSMAAAMIKIRSLRLGPKFNLTQLTSRFDELIPYCGIEDNEQMKIQFYTDCLPDNIKIHVFLKSPTTYEEARRYATEFGLTYDRIDADNGK